MKRTDIYSLIEKPYSRVAVHTLLDALFPERFTVHPSITDDELDIGTARKLGLLELDDGMHRIEVVEVQTRDSVRIQHNKVTLRRGTYKYFDGIMRSGVLAFFYNSKEKNYRLSFVSRWTALEDGKPVKMETAPKRYTFLLGPGGSNISASSQLCSLTGNKKSVAFKDLIRAFSVDALSKEFFEGYKECYLNFVEELTGKRMVKRKGKWEEVQTGDPGPQLEQYFKSNDKDARNYVKIMLGRIVFLYFLQKKGWLGASSKKYTDGSHNFMNELWDSCENKDEGFYSQYLIPLFYRQLNNPSENKEAYELPDGRRVYIPYLNGGLFDKTDYTAKDDETLWFAPKHFEQLFSFLAQYNFTIDENDTIDHEIGIDPEMLGHIFENLLEDNKDKGAFYTPREIVQYMTRESLCEYLKTRCRADKLRITKKSDLSLSGFVREKEVDDFIATHADRLNRYLDEVRVCDPAIGSGAFPMGMLTEIFLCKTALNPEIEGAQRNALKKHIIEESIYGVDIEKGAVDIARLRFWLSLVIDEETPEPLPNLDYKIVTGDSLVSTFEGRPINLQWSIGGNTKKNYEKDVKELTEEIAHLQRRYFTSSEADKQKYRIKIRELKLSLLQQQYELAAGLFESKHDWNVGLDGKMSKQQLENRYELDLMHETINRIRQLRKEKAHSFAHFDWKLDFPEVFFLHDDSHKPGFDIVIGNPPYVQLQKDGGRLSELFQNQEYTTFERTGDLYVIFYEKGMTLLAEDGVLSYITSNKWMRAGYGKKLREYFTKYNPLTLIDLGPSVFDNATVDTNILLIQNRKTESHSLRAVTLNDRFTLESMNTLQFLALDILNDEKWSILPKEEQSIKIKIEEYGTQLNKWNLKINFGIKTGLNDAFIIDEATKDRMMAEDPKSAEIIKPLLRGRDIKRYKAEFADKWLIFIPWHFPYHKDDSIVGASQEAEEAFEQQYPTLYSYLNHYKDSLSKRNKAETGIRYEWYALQRCAATYYNEFEKEKIVWKRIGSILRFCYTDSGELALDSTVIATGEKIKYLTAVLNSKLHRKELHNNAPKTGTGDSIISVQALTPHYVHYPSKNEEKAIVAVLDSIINKLSENHPIEEDVLKIDLIVYKLYHLTYDEVKVVDPDFRMSRKEYDEYEVE